ncbi:MAG: hypothetical protein ACOCQM_03115 [Natronomonas sp.]
MLLLAGLLTAASGAVRGFAFAPLSGTFFEVPLDVLIAQGLLVAAVGFAAYGGYFLVFGFVASRTTNKRRRHDLRNVLRFVFIAAAVVGGVSGRHSTVRRVAVLARYRRVRDYLGDTMSNRIAAYRERLAETPVELEVRDRPSVNVVQKESWVELRLRCLVHPRQGSRVRNELYERILARMNDNPDRVAFPVSRSR